MKKSLLIIAILMLVVGFSGKVFAQTSSTPDAPFDGFTHSYVVDGLTSGDQYVFGINQSNSDFSHEASGPYTVTGHTDESSPMTLSGTTATLTVEWSEDASDSNPTFYVWIKIIDQEGCATYRYLPVNPVEAPVITEPYDVTYNVLALMTGGESTTSSDLIAAEGTNNLTGACPGFIDYDWQSSTDGSDDANDGDTYAFFKINRTSSLGGARPWSITPSATFSGTATWEYSTDNGANFTTFTPGSSLSSNVASIYVRARFENSTAEQTVALSIANGTETGVDEDDYNVTYSNEDASITLLPLPTVSGFGFSE